MTRSWLLLGVMACSTGGDSDTSTTTTSGVAAGVAGGSAGGAAGGSPSTGTTSVDPVQQMCARWSADRADMGEGSWSGSVATCDSGTLSSDAIDNTVKLVNLYRWLAGVPPVTDDSARNQEAQDCALILHANDLLTHSPDSSMTCYSQSGDDGAGSSNIATTTSVAAIDLYMVDYGSADTLGHRRWILSNSLGPVGVGGTSEYSCLHVIGGTGNAGAAWTAFPSPGAFPMEAMTLSSWASVDEEGWSIQSDSIDLSSATVRITRAGQDLPVVVDVLPANFGSSYALGIRPNGWTSEPGTYEVNVTGVSQPIDYSVELVECGAR